MEEKSGPHLFGFVQNLPTGRIDSVGLSILPPEALLHIPEHLFYEWVKDALEDAIRDMMWCPKAVQALQAGEKKYQILSYAIRGYNGPPVVIYEYVDVAWNPFDCQCYAVSDHWDLEEISIGTWPFKTVTGYRWVKVTDMDLTAKCVVDWQMNKQQCVQLAKKP